MLPTERLDTVKSSLKLTAKKITLYKAAKQAFSELGVEKLPTVKQMNEEYAELLVTVI